MCKMNSSGSRMSHRKTEYMSMNERNTSGTVRLQGAEMKKVEDFQSSDQWREWKRGEEACGSRFERMEKSVRSDKRVSARLKGKTMVRLWSRGEDRRESWR